MVKTRFVGLAAVALAAYFLIAQGNASEWTYDGNVQPVCNGCDDGCDCGDGCCDCGDGCLDCGDACDSGCGGCALKGLSLSSLLGMECSGIEVGGWTQFGYHSKATPLSTFHGNNLSYNDVPHRLNLQQQWFHIGRAADGSNGLDFGFRADFVYGTDAQKTQAFGSLTNHWDNPWDHGVYGWALPQLYGEVAVGDLSVIIGHFFTLTGYEVVGATGNFFYSHALTMFNTEPFTHTGVLTTYSGFEGLTLYNGWSLGWDTGFDNVNSGNSYLGGVGVDLTDSTTLTYILNWGNFGTRGNGGDDSYSHSIVLDVALSDRLEYVFQTDALRTPNTGGDQVGINQYLFFQYNDKVKLGGRVEWWKDNGMSYCEATGGVNINVLENLVLRPEYRKDWVPSTAVDQDTFGMDVIVTY